MEILVIGSEPPCVRCHRTLELAEEAAQQLGVKVKMRRVSANSEEAKKYGKIGTFHDIVKAAKLSYDGEKIRRLVKVWSKELDNEIMPYRQKAEEMGYLLTPVLVINGQVKNMGFVPEKEQIREWIKGELSH